MEICWRTKKEDPPRGKPKVYLSCYESDFSTFGKKITINLDKQILVEFGFNLETTIFVTLATLNKQRCSLYSISGVVHNPI